MENLTPDQLAKEQDQLIAAGSSISFREIYNQEITIPMVKAKYYRPSDVDDVFVTINGIFREVSEQAHRQNKALTEAREDLIKTQELVEEKDRLITKLQKQNTAVEAHLDNMVAKVSELSKQPEVDSEEVEHLKSQVAYLTAENTKLRTNHDAIARELSDKETAYKRLLDSTSARFEEVKDVTEKVKDLDKLISDLDMAKESNQLLSYELETMRLELVNARNDVAIEQGKALTVTDEYKALDKEYQLLKYKFENLQKLQRLKR